GADVRSHLRFDAGRASVTHLRDDGVELEDRPCDDPLEVLKDVLSRRTVWEPDDLPRFSGGAVGWLGFDCVRAFEPSVPLPDAPGLGAPMGEMLVADAIAAYDHVKRQVVLIVHAPLEGDRALAYDRALDRLHAMIGRLSLPHGVPEAPWLLPTQDPGEIEASLPIRSNRTQEDMEHAVRVAKQAIEAGEVFQVVPSQRLSVPVEVDPLVLYRALRAVNPSPYMFLLRLDERSLVGASPEVLVRLEDDELLVRPIAGTRPRGETPAEDEALAAELLADEKELAEHRMLVDLGRNDLGRVAARGTVRVEDPEHIERYAHVMHIVTDVRARLREGLDAFDVLRACFPAGTVSGAPKIRAAELLATLEPDRRGPYAGAVGYFGFDGSLDTCIAIRTLVVDAGGVHVQAGAGVVHDSDPTSEHLECRRKALSCLRALQLALQRTGSLGGAA
ncbi:MAG: chorismate-binding protein, partial [Myxococcales bacterium]|nr:chorismate-binding protein [Myxococcales bacterium]